MAPIDRAGLTTWNEDWALAVLFGVVSVPWVLGFAAVDGLPLWPSFLASGTVFAAGAAADPRAGDTPTGLAGRPPVQALASNLVGIGYAAASLAIAEWFGGNGVVLALAVGGFMLLVGLHAFVPLLAFRPGAVVGFAALFSVAAGGAALFGLSGFAGAAVATAVSMVVGWGIGVGVAVGRVELG
jgi:hypothetical protein